jgi:hypothetical protein
MARRLRTACLLAALSVAASPAAGQPKGNAARAQTLFNEASADLDQGKVAPACKKLEEVVTLLPEAVGARETLGECYSKLGKPGSAWTHYSAAASLAAKQGEAERAKSAERQAAAMRARAPAVIVDVPEDVAAIPSLAVSIDDKPVAPAQWGSALPIDAGEHQIVASAPGLSPFRKRWTAAAGPPVTVTVDGLDALDAGPSGTADGGSGAGSGPGAAGEGAPRSWQLPVGIAAAGVGLAAIGVGSALGILAIDRKNASNTAGHCDATGCDDTGFALRTEALALGNGATAAFVVGGLLLAGGVVLAVLAPRRPGPAKAAPTLRFTGTGLSLGGHF